MPGEAWTPGAGAGGAGAVKATGGSPGRRGVRSAGPAGGGEMTRNGPGSPRAGRPAATGRRGTPTGSDRGAVSTVWR